MLVTLGTNKVAMKVNASYLHLHVIQVPHEDLVNIDPVKVLFLKGKNVLVHLIDQYYIFLLKSKSSIGTQDCKELLSGGYQ